MILNGIVLSSLAAAAAWKASRTRHAGGAPANAGNCGRRRGSSLNGLLRTPEAAGGKAETLRFCAILLSLKRDHSAA
jgi:hypothetical protein